jgi:hypothetical protein
MVTRMVRITKDDLTAGNRHTGMGNALAIALERAYSLKPKQRWLVGAVDAVGWPGNTPRAILPEDGRAWVSAEISGSPVGPVAFEVEIQESPSQPAAKA